VTLEALVREDGTDVPIEFDGGGKRRIRRGCLTCWRRRLRGVHQRRTEERPQRQHPHPHPRPERPARGCTHRIPHILGNPSAVAPSRYHERAAARRAERAGRRPSGAALHTQCADRSSRARPARLQNLPVGGSKPFLLQCRSLRPDQQQYSRLLRDGIHCARRVTTTPGCSRRRSWRAASSGSAHSSIASGWLTPTISAQTRRYAGSPRTNPRRFRRSCPGSRENS
jgi:hypothetical protein